jgi:hypothetical protein
MKKIFELQINGKFTQYILPSEIKLIKWEKGLIFTLTPTEITNEHYKRITGKL